MINPRVHRLLNGGLEAARIGKAVGFEVTFKRARRLGADGAKIKQCRNDAFNVKLDILETLQAEDADVPAEKGDLIDQNDASVGDDPKVEVVVGPYGEATHEGDECPGGNPEGNESSVLTPRNIELAQRIGQEGENEKRDKR